MPRRLIAAFAVLLCLLPVAAAAQGQPVLAHVCIIPSPAPGPEGGKDRVAAFEAWLCRRFGGFTRLGQGRGGWTNEQGKPETETNAVYLVTTGSDVSAELAKRIKRDFDVRVPYVLVFPAALTLGGAS